MADVALTQFLPQVRTHVPGCPSEVMLEAILNACIQFCEETWIVREDIPAGNAILNTDDYTISPQVGREVVGVKNLLYKEKSLNPTTEELLDIEDAGWRTADSGTPISYIQLEPGRVRLNRAPDETTVGGLIPTIVTKPAKGVTTVEERLYNDWEQAIKYGALTELLEIPEKKWSDMKQSVWYGKRFNHKIQLGKARARMGNQRVPNKVRNRAWV